MYALKYHSISLFFKNDMGYDFLAVICNLFSIYAMVLFHVSEDFG